MLGFFPVGPRSCKPKDGVIFQLGRARSGGTYSYTEADIACNPILRIENGELEMHAVGLKYIRAFEWLGTSARVCISQGYVDAKWTGTMK